MQNYFKKAGFCEIEEDDSVSDDPFSTLKDTVTQLIDLDKTFEDVTVEDVASFDDMLMSTQEPLSDEDILAGFYLLMFMPNTSATMRRTLNLRFPKFQLNQTRSNCVQPLIR